MKKVNIYIIVDFRKGQSSPWEVLLRCNNHEKSITGNHKARTEGGLKTYALKTAIDSLKADCHIDVYALPAGLKDLVFSDNKPEMLAKCIPKISQFFWLRENDLPYYLDPVVRRVEGQ